MKNLKKFAVLGLSVTMALSLAACGSGGKETTADVTSQTATGEVDKNQKLIV